MSDNQRTYRGVGFSLWDEGWTAECDVCNTLAVAAKTKRECERLIKLHIEETHVRRDA